MNWNDKYRPKSFKEFIGNRDTLTQIEGFILSGDIPHLLFEGDKGTGKTALAEVVGLKLLGEGNPNFIELNASDERDEHHVRKLVKSIRNMPLGASFRVLLWDEFNLKPTAQDLLKRPMEKVKNTIHIITTNDINSVIEPIQSRCAVFHFIPLSEGDITEGLKRIAIKENLTLTEQQLKEIAKKSNGDMRTAVNELQKASALNNRNVEIDKIVQQYMKAQPQGAQGVKA
jgi:replication factor C small subunit